MKIAKICKKDKKQMLKIEGCEMDSLTKSFAK